MEDNLGDVRLMVVRKADGGLDGETRCNARDDN
jgi:hypothetical protein